MPDALSAAACIAAWVVPDIFGRDGVKLVVLSMLAEFLLIHGAGLFTGLGGMRRDARKVSTLAAIGLCALYLVFMVAFSWSFGTWSPLLLFAWLMAGKVVWAYSDEARNERKVSARMATWGFSAAAYLFAVAIGVLLPLPRLGLTPQVVDGLALPGSGLWVEQPHTAVAGMAIYFLLLAGFKWKMHGRMPLSG